MRFCFTAEAIADGVVRLRYVPSDMNFADMFTKALSIPIFKRLRAMAVADKYAHLRTRNGPATSMFAFILQVDDTVVCFDYVGTSSEASLLLMAAAG